MIEQIILPINSLVLYKKQPARVISIGEKIEIELNNELNKKVRAKDIVLLHPGPCLNFNELIPQPGDLNEAWEILEGSQISLRDLAELVFMSFTPATAWATWKLITADVTFCGTPNLLEARPRAVVERERAARMAKAAAEQDWKNFLSRVATATLTLEDAVRLSEIERLAFAQTHCSRILAALGYSQTPENAHRELIKIGYWTANYNPHPIRCGAPTQDPDFPIPDLMLEDRLDLTYLAAYAIDDEGNQDPDDAISIENERLWVHIADVAALITPQSASEREARARGVNLYLPEGVTTMLPPLVTTRLGLGVAPISPALSFGIDCAQNGEIQVFKIIKTWVRVTRISYESVEQRLTQAPFAEMYKITERFHTWRNAQGALDIILPEVNVRVRADKVEIRPLLPLRSRALVTDAMLMAGVVAARFCLQNNLPIPYATQPAIDVELKFSDLASMFALRRSCKPTRLLTEPDRHAGLGLPLYTRVTSPLRRYSDLLVHQQINACLTGQPSLSLQQVNERMGEAELGAIIAKRSERLSNQHWKLVFLRDVQHWQGEGIVVGREERKTTFLIPDLALETRLRLREELPLNTKVQLALNDVDLPELTANFQLLSVSSEAG